MVAEGVHDAPEGFVTEHELRFTGRRPSVLAFDDLGVGAADPNRDGFDED